MNEWMEQIDKTFLSQSCLWCDALANKWSAYAWRPQLQTRNNPTDYSQTAEPNLSNPTTPSFE